MGRATQVYAFFFGGLGTTPTCLVLRRNLICALILDIPPFTRNTPASGASDSMGVGALTIETPIGTDRRSAFLVEFKVRYNQAATLVNQPPDPTLDTLRKLDARRAADVRNTGHEPAKLRDAPLRSAQNFAQAPKKRK